MARAGQLQDFKTAVTMTQSQRTTSKRTLTFVSGRTLLNSILAAVVVTVLAVAMVVVLTLRGIGMSGDSLSWAILFVIVGWVSLFVFPRRWIVEIDPTAQRLMISRYFMLRWTAMAVWTTVVEHCAFDECSATGTVPDNLDDPDSYGVYLDFKRGGRHVIPVGGPADEASRLAAELSAATGIPRRDVDSWHRPLPGGSSNG
jgi:hypothetical protein